MAALCDCEVLEETCLGNKLKSMENVGQSCDYFMHNNVHIPCCYYRGGRVLTFHLDVLLPVILVPVLIFTAAQGLIWTIVAFASFPIVLLLLYAKCLRWQQRTKFFYSWSIASLVFLIAVFEVQVIPYLEILLYENLTFKALILAMLASIYFVKNDPGTIEGQTSTDEEEICNSNNRNNFDSSYLSGLDSATDMKMCMVCRVLMAPRSGHCKVCSACIMRRDHHCVWLDTCVGARNHRAFVLSLFFGLVSCLYGANLTITTVCSAAFVWDFFLLPSDCSGVYDSIYVAVCFVSAIYMLIIALAMLLVLIHQLWLISVNMTVEEWRQTRSLPSSLGTRLSWYQGIHSRGLIQNWRCFMSGDR